MTTIEAIAKAAGVGPADMGMLRKVGQSVRDLMNQHPLPENVIDSVLAAWRSIGESYAYAERSSATAEDLPTASFAGQQDTYLNVIGTDMLLERVKQCFISLYSDRAILYRIQQGFPHRLVALSVAVQRMVMPQVSGILFTADPISEHRGICSIDASFGLGEAPVSGSVNADLFKVNKREKTIISREIATKKIAILPLEGGGTHTVDLQAAEQKKASLTSGRCDALHRIANSCEPNRKS